MDSDSAKTQQYTLMRSTRLSTPVAQVVPEAVRNDSTLLHGVFECLKIASISWLGSKIPPMRSLFIPTARRSVFSLVGGFPDSDYFGSNGVFGRGKYILHRCARGYAHSSMDKFSLSGIYL